jgi:hypothetical protein
VVGRQVEELNQCRIDIQCGHQLRYPPAPQRPPSHTHAQGNAYLVLMKGIAVVPTARFPKALPVVGREHHDHSVLYVVGA